MWKRKRMEGKERARWIVDDSQRLFCFCRKVLQLMLFSRNAQHVVVQQIEFGIISFSNRKGNDMDCLIRKLMAASMTLETINTASRNKT